MAETSTSIRPRNVAPPCGRTSTTSPAKPTNVLAIAGRLGRSPVALRMAMSHNGTDAITSEASPVGTCRSATKRIPFAPGSSTPISNAEPSARRATRNGARPLRTSTIAAINPPASRKRTPAAKSGGIVSPASSIPRYVEPQMT